MAVQLTPVGADALVRAGIVKGGRGFGFMEPEPHEITPTPEEHAQVDDTVRQSQQFFAQYGLGEQDGNGADLAIRFLGDYPNASYAHSPYGDESMQIGQDPDTGKSFAGASDVIAHEYTHRVMNGVLHLDTWGESGVINESLADTFSKAITGGDWTMGASVHPGGLRSMSDPARPQDEVEIDGKMRPAPSTVYDYAPLPMYDDAGGVHVNIGIPNRAAAMIGERLGRQTMADIYMGAVLNHMSPHSGIADTARATMQSAVAKFGASSEQSQAVSDAWKAVGLDARTGSIIPRDESGDLGPLAAPRAARDGARRIIIIRPF